MTTNINKCLVTKSHFGYDEYYNICTHEVQDVVPWVAADYLEMTLLLSPLVLLVIALVVSSFIIYDMSK